MERQKVLIVDDEERNIKLLNAYLMTNQYEIVEASNGEEALRMVNDFNPDLVLLDAMMPGIDGFEVCKRLKTDEKTNHIPVILLTAKASKENKMEGSIKFFDAPEPPVSYYALFAHTRRDLLEKFNKHHDEVEFVPVNLQ